MESPRTVQTMLRPPLGHSVRLLFGIFAAPFAWAVQLVASYALAAASCFAGSVALVGEARSGRMPLVVIAVACLLVGLAGFGVAVQQSRLTSAPTDAQHTPRSRALAAVGVLSSALFLGAIAFSILTLSMSPQCAG